jgi:RNA polymerase sigma factor for flagellar operon FliA
LATQIGRWPTQRELAVKLGITLREVQEIQQHASSRYVSLEHMLSEGSETASRWDPADNDDRDDPATAMERGVALNLLSQAVDSLSERDQAILQLRYAESRPFHEVGRQLGLSESRVCQLHKRILKQLRRQLSTTLEEAA